MKKFIINSFKRMLQRLGSKPLFSLLYRSNSEAWILSEKYLFDYNKNLITLSSSSIVLSFTVIQLAKLNVDKGFIIRSWVSFLVVILAGSILYLLRYFANFAIETRNSHGYESNDEGNSHTTPEATYFFIATMLMYILAIVEIIAFSFAFISLIVAAIQSLNSTYWWC